MCMHINELLVEIAPCHHAAIHLVCSKGVVNGVSKTTKLNMLLLQHWKRENAIRLRLCEWIEGQVRQNWRKNVSKLGAKRVGNTPLNTAGWETKNILSPLSIFRSQSHNVRSQVCHSVSAHFMTCEV